MSYAVDQPLPVSEERILMLLHEAVGAARSGDWRPAAEILANTGKDWDLRSICVHTLAQEAPGAWLDAWNAAEPQSPDAAVVTAQSLVSYAWRIRGSAYAHKTKPEQLRRFRELLPQADAVAQEAVKRAPHDPTPLEIRITIARGIRLSNKRFKALWQELTSLAPTHRSAHLQAFEFWSPKWQGTNVGELGPFVRGVAKRVPNTMLVVELYIRIILEFHGKSRRRESAVGRARSIRGRLLLRKALSHWDGTIPSSGWHADRDRNILAWALTVARRYDEACEVFEAIGDRMATDLWSKSGYATAREGFQSLRAEALHGRHQPVADLGLGSGM